MRRENRAAAGEREGSDMTYPLKVDYFAGSRAARDIALRQAGEDQDLGRTAAASKWVLGQRGSRGASPQDLRQRHIGKLKVAAHSPNDRRKSSGRNQEQSRTGLGGEQTRAQSSVSPRSAEDTAEPDQAERNSFSNAAHECTAASPTIIKNEQPQRKA